MKPTFSSLLVLGSLLGFIASPFIHADESEESPPPKRHSEEPRSTPEDAPPPPLKFALFSPESQRVTVRWQLTGETPPTITRYLIQSGRLMREVEETRYFRWTDLQETEGDVNQWTMPAPEDTTWYRVIGFLEDGSFVSGPAQRFHPITLPPASPIRLTFDRIEPRAVTLAWSPPAGAEPTPTIVERARSFSGPWQTISTVPSGGRMFQDRFLEPNTDYYYRVRSTGGTLSWQSQPERVRTLP